MNTPVVKYIPVVTVTSMELAFPDVYRTVMGYMGLGTYKYPYIWSTTTFVANMRSCQYAISKKEYTRQTLEGVLDDNTTTRENMKMFEAFMATLPKGTVVLLKEQ